MRRSAIFLFMAIMSAASISGTNVMPATVLAASTPVVTEASVTAGTDDAEEFANGALYLDSSDLELVDADEGAGQTVGMRFPGLNIPQGVSITDAWVQFTVDEAQSGPATLTIVGHDADATPTFTTATRNISSRVQTTATVTWQPDPWTAVGSASVVSRTPNLRPIVQEVVDRPGWTTASALALVITGTGQRTAMARDAGTAGAPRLHVEYTPSAPPTSTSTTTTSPTSTSTTTTTTTVSPPPPTTTTSRFAVVGDYGNGGSDAGQVADVIDRLAVDAVLTTGDNSYTNNRIDDNVGRHYQAYIGSYRGAYGTGAPVNRFFPVLGNHDYSDGGGLAAYLDYFTLPGAGVAGSGRTTHERYYDVVLGPVHYFALNSNPEEPDGMTAGSVQAQWLRDGLAASTSPWQIVLLHHSPYSSGAEHGSDPALQWPFASWGADAVLSGHDHDYERLEVDGIPYIVSGLGGVSRYAHGTTDPHSRYFYNADDGALLVEACTGRLEFSLHTVASGVLDSYRVGSPTCEPPLDPTITLERTDGVAAEPGADTGAFTVRRAGPTDQPLDVTYTVGGTATPDLDYTALDRTVTIPVGADHAVITVAPLDDNVFELDETLVVTLTDGAAYDLRAPSSATVIITSDDPAPPVVRDLFASSQVRVSGTVSSGDLASLQSSDNQRLVLRETGTSGSRRTSQLEFRWTFTVPVNQQLSFVVEAHHSVNGEGDDMIFEWSRSGAPFQLLVTVAKTSDNDLAQTMTLPAGISGTVTVRVRDANRTAGRTVLDTISIDRMVLRATTAG